MKPQTYQVMILGMSQQKLNCLGTCKEINEKKTGVVGIMISPFPPQQSEAKRRYVQKNYID